MPLIFHSQINPATKIGVWHITEGEEFFLADVSVQRSITHPHKRLQHLAGRYLLRELFSNFPLALIEIADTRKPFLADEAFHFSISHCGDYAAAIVSTENRVGVDIEIPHPKIQGIKHKFLSRSEQELFGEIPSMLTMAWSIKEAVFKWYGEGQVDFINHFEITEIQKNSLGYKANCFLKKGNTTNLKVQNISLQGITLTWLIT